MILPYWTYEDQVYDPMEEFVFLAFSCSAALQDNLSKVNYGSLSILKENLHISSLTMESQRIFLSIWSDTNRKEYLKLSACQITRLKTRIKHHHRNFDEFSIYLKDTQHDICELFQFHTFQTCDCLNLINTLLYKYLKFEDQAYNLFYEW